MFNYAPLVNSTIPFSLPGSSIATAAKSGFSLSSIFNGIQKTATTINQIVPLYHNVKPIISNSKTIFSIMKGMTSAPLKQQPKQEQKKDTIIDVQPTTPKEEKVEIHTINTPNKPFFS